jgi:hypothetical protein
MGVSTGSFFENNRKVVGIAAGAITVLCLAFIVVRMTASETVVIPVDESAAALEWKNNLMKRETEIYWQLGNLNIATSEDNQTVTITGTATSADELKKLKQVLESIEPKGALKGVDIQVVKPN